MIQARKTEACTIFVMVGGLRSGWNQHLLMDLTGRYKKEFKGGVGCSVWQLVMSVNRACIYWDKEHRWT